MLSLFLLELWEISFLFYLIAIEEMRFVYSLFFLSLSISSNCFKKKIILGDGSHIYHNEQGGCASLGGVMPRVLKNQPDGTISLDTLK